MGWSKGTLPENHDFEHQKIIQYQLFHPYPAIFPSNQWAFHAWQPPPEPGLQPHTAPAHSFVNDSPRAPLGVEYGITPATRSACGPERQVIAQRNLWAHHDKQRGNCHN